MIFLVKFKLRSINSQNVFVIVSFESSITEIGLDNGIMRGSFIAEYSKYNHNTINANKIKWSTTISGFTLMKKLLPGYDQVHNYARIMILEMQECSLTYIYINKKMEYKCVIWFNSHDEQIICSQTISSVNRIMDHGYKAYFLRLIST